MTRKFLLSGFGALLLLTGGIANAGPINQFEACVNIDSDPLFDDGIYSVGPGCAVAPGTSGNVFDGIGDDGLGTVTVTVTGAGAHFVDMFVDWESDEATDTFFNEYGEIGGALDGRQSWEIDEPGFLFGDIFDNFLDSSLANSNALPSGLEEDVSLALGWDFTLAAGDTATIDFVLSRLMPQTGFWLSQVDEESGDAFFFSSTLTITGTAVPEPGTLWLLGAGLLGLGLSRRRNLADS